MSFHLPKPKTIEEAVTALAQAETIQAIAAYQDEYAPVDAILNRGTAAELKSTATALLRPPEEIIECAGHEKGLSHRDGMPGVIETLDDPNMVNLRASEERLELLGNSLVVGVDAADTIRPQNSLEKMLAHQMGAVHRLGMKLLDKVEFERDEPTATRRLNSAMRCFEAYRRSLVALQKIRTGGTQTLVVQHVNVSNGGQAVVAGMRNELRPTHAKK